METEQFERAPKPTKAETESLSFQLAILKDELEHIQNTIARMDEITQTTKNWAILVWGGSVLLALGDPVLRDYLFFTALLPLLFWYIDGRWRYLQRRSSFRARKISQFLNDGRLTDSFQMGKLTNFTVYDPIGSQYDAKKDPDYANYVSMRKALSYAEVMGFYGALVLVSIFLALIF
ncbi:hypothetical protein [Candidatus Leptofilum sp.]|uniref:hypothetical protein n=1 Tax=Candidatus Leptofilum sp. TaxID=3241576 RepID=UPI003B59E12D